MNRLILIAALTTAIVVGWSASASAQVARIFWTGRLYHVEVCPQSAPGFARCHAHAVSDSTGRHLVNRFGRNARAQLAPQGFGPTDLRSAYNLTATGSASTTIAIVDAYGYTNAEADLAVYRSQYGLPACSSASGCFTKYNESGQKTNLPKMNTDWAEETALDLDMASAMCPNCKIILIEATSSSYADLAAAENEAAKLGARVISNSYGGGEAGTQSYESAYNHPGVAVTVSSGDDGYGVQFPASSPHVTAVGGTSLVRSSVPRGWSESAWTDGGSGCSKVYAKPTWQTDPLCTMRMEADVSAVADPNTGVAVYGPVSTTTSAWQVYGGTSVAAPLIGGIYAANGAAVTSGSAPYANTAWLYDVTNGTNGKCGGTYFCTAEVGYDGPTGLGTPNGTKAF
jgi:subtilase family serine protease